MHSSRVKKHHRYGDDDDELSPVARPDDRHAESYTRPHHHHSAHHGRTDAYTDSPTSRRGYSATSSHNQHPHDWRTTEANYSSASRDRYRSDEYSHSRHEDYPERADSWSNRPSEHASYSSRPREWTTREEASRTATSYSEGRSYAAESRYEERSKKTHDNWPREQSRSERERSRYDRDERYANPPPVEREWRPRNEVRAEEVSRSRRAADWKESVNERREWRASNREKSKERSQEQDRPAQVEERQWEPAPSWKDSEPPERQHERYDYAESSQTTNRHNKKVSKAKKKAQQAMQRREGRKDEMNNWQKRDRAAPNSTKETAYKDRDYAPASSVKRKHLYSPDSRSRSPARSTNSKRSHRSRSRSLSPKRSARETASHLEDSSYKQTSVKYDDARGRSPEPYNKRGDTKGRARHASDSSASSRSRSRSGSRSGDSDVRRRAKHRLPTATSLRDIERQAKSMRLSTNQSSRRTLEKANGGSAVAKKFDRRPSIGSSTRTREADIVLLQYDDLEAMPPPAQPNSSTSSHFVSSVQTASTATTEKQTNGTKRHAGFKPIGGARPRASASIKRFFPEDEDEDENETDISAKYNKAMEDPTSPVSVRSRASDRGSATARTQSPYYSPRDRDVKAGEARPINGANEEHFVRAEHVVETVNHMEVAPPVSTDRPTENGYHERRAIRGANDQLYTIVGQVGEGTFGKVYKARNTVTGVHVALKRIRMETERDGFPVTAMREIKLLQSLRHANVVQLMEMMVHRGSVYMVFEYMDHDLTGVLSQTQFSFSDAHLKSLCQQMLQGLSYLHRKGVVHRDIKGSNILLNNRGELKLADFGLARFYQKRRRADYTNRVITLWYRPPELLLGTTVYGPEVDMWSAGCIMLELFCKKPVFQGNDEIHQLDVIYKIMGTPSTENWPGLVDMPWYELVKPRETIRNRFRDLFHKWLSPAALDLAEKLLSYDPTQRATADQALEASYFSEEQPAPMLPGLSALEGEWHEFESRRERAKKRRKIEGVVASAESTAPQNQ